MRPQVLIQLYGATATRLLSNFQLVVVWVLAVALFYSFDSHPLLHGIGAPRCAAVRGLRFSTSKNLKPVQIQWLYAILYIYIYIYDAAGEPWDWADAGYKLAGAVLIVAGNYAYFEYRSAARSAAGLQPLEPEAFEV
jgi:hypothetical protein